MLDTYAKDPVLAVVPDGAECDGDVSRTKACRRLSRGSVSNTAVNLRWRLSRPYDESALRRTYEATALRGGWHADPDAAPATSMSHETYLTYCRKDGAVVSRLHVHSVPDQRMATRSPGAGRPGPAWSVNGPGGIDIMIAADLVSDTCPERGSSLD